MKYFSVLSVCLLLFSACTDGDNKSEPIPQEEQLIEVKNPANNSKATCGQEVKIDVSILKPEALESVHIYWNDSLIEMRESPKGSISLVIPTKNARVGINDLKVKTRSREGKEDEDNRSVVLFSDIFADIQLAKIVKTYPHQKTSYTQGLEFYHGELYEGTGLTGQSILAKTDLNSGNILQKIDLPPSIFGEGITILNDKIYQITWQARICYVYDVKSLEKIKEYSYFGEGWGLTNDGNNLIMSNGTSEIAFRDPKTFEKIRSIYVFDSEKEYVSINELEYVDGVIYANVYQEKFILKIDPKTGKVLSKIDCSDLVKEGQGLGDVLNGIAYNHQTERFYMTGKNWPKLFEVKFAPF